MRRNSVAFGSSDKGKPPYSARRATLANVLVARRPSVADHRRCSDDSKPSAHLSSKLHVVSETKSRGQLSNSPATSRASSLDSRSPSASRSASRSGSRAPVKSTRRSVRRSTKKGTTSKRRAATEEPNHVCEGLEIAQPPSPNPASFFRQNIVRRHVYSNAKIALESQPPRVGRKLADIVGAVVSGTKQVLFKEKILGAFIRSSCERQMKDMIKETVRHALKTRDWVAFKESLTDLLEESAALEIKYNGMVELQAIRSDLEAMLASCEQQRSLTGEAIRLVGQVFDMDVDNAADAENAWQVLGIGEDKIQKAHGNVDDLWQMAVTVVAPDSPTIKRSVTQEFEKFDQPRMRRNSRSLLSLAELHADLDGQISCLPVESMKEIKQLIVAVTDTIMPEGIQQQCFKIIRSFGAAEDDIPKILERIRETAWKEVADAAMSDLKKATNETAADIKNAKGKLLAHYPQLLQRPSSLKDTGSLQPPCSEPSEVSSLHSEPSSPTFARQPVATDADDRKVAAVDDGPFQKTDMGVPSMPTMCTTESKEESGIMMNTDSILKGESVEYTDSILKGESVEISQEFSSVDATLPDQQEPQAMEDCSLSLDVNGESRGPGEDQRDTKTASSVLRQDVPDCVGRSGRRISTVRKDDVKIPAAWRHSSTGTFGVVGCSIVPHEVPKIEEMGDESLSSNQSPNLKDQETKKVDVSKQPPDIPCKSEPVEREIGKGERASDPLYKFAKNCSDHKESPGLALLLGLGRLQKHVFDNWGSVSEAAARIAGQHAHEQTNAIEVPTLVAALQASGYPCDDGEICSLFSMLGATDVQQNADGPPRVDFMRLGDIEKHIKNDDYHSATWQAYYSLQHHSSHRLLVNSLSGPEQLIAEIHVAKARVMSEASQGLCSTSDTWRTSLATVLERCFADMCGLHAEEYADIIVSPRGLAVILDVVLNPSIPSVLRALAVSVVSMAVERSGGRAFKAHTWAERAMAQTVSADVTSSKAWLSEARVRSDAFMGCTDQLWRETKTCDMHLHFVPEIDISMAPRVRIPTPPMGEEEYQPGNFEILLAKLLWRPILEHIDPDSTKPMPLSPSVFAQLLALLRQSQLPAVLAGLHGMRIVIPIIAALRRLQGQGRKQQDTRKVLTAFNDLCACVSTSSVHRLAAALGGRRLLRDRIAELNADTEPELVEQARNLATEWNLERRRINVRWPLSKARPLEIAKFNAVVNTAERTAAESISSREVRGVEWVRPSLLTAPAPPNTAQLQPSLLLQMRGWNIGDDENLISWLDGHAASLASPRGYSCSRRNTSRRKLPPL